MSSGAIYLTVGLAVFLIGLHGLLVLQDNLRRVIAVNLMGAGVFLVLVALATRTNPVDPVLQAMAVTGLVVAISATAFALHLVRAEIRHQQHSEKSDDERLSSHKDKPR
jgi:multicomponent Na+:H+ antiporter subunit C